jgi:glycine hydroxymethyltransferase
MREPRAGPLSLFCGVTLPAVVQYRATFVELHFWCGQNHGGTLLRMPIRSELPLADIDPEIAQAIQNETLRQHDGLEMIASENFVSRAVLEAAGSVFTNKYAEGYPGKRYYGGCEYADVVENLTRDRAKRLFGAEHANVQPHSGSQANAAAYMTLLEPGDTILGLDLAHGGHLTHGHKLNFSGKLYRIAGYKVRQDTETIDYDQLQEQAELEKPKLIVGGGSAYPRQFDFPRLRQIADSVGAKLLIDMAHFAGLVAGGVHPSPVPHAHVVTTTTHKTLRGPRSGLILCTQDLAQGMDRSVFPGQQGGPLVHVIAAKAVAFGEALRPEFKAYAAQIVANAKALADALASHGFRVISGGTDTHVVLIDVFNNGAGMLGSEAESALGQAGITVNKNAIPYDTNPPLKPSGIRLGTPALTTRGMEEEEMRIIAGWIAEALTHRRDETRLRDIRNRVRDLAEEFPLYGWLRQEEAAALLA